MSQSRGATLFLGLLLLGSCARSAEQPAPIPKSLALPAPIELLGGVAVREPMVLEHPTGALFVAGYSRAVEETLRPPKLFRSLDGGGSWEPVDVGTPEQGAIGNSDVDLAVAADGTLYFLTMGFDRSTGEGTHVAVGVSTDVGDSWTWTMLSRDRLVDRPWIVVDGDGEARVIWNDGAGVRFAVSMDGGRTWQEQARIHPHGLSSHLAVGPEGELGVRITPLSASGNRYDEGVDLLAVSLDGGTTWAKHPLPGERIWQSDPTSATGVPRWVEPLAWDGEGALYTLGSEGTQLWLGRSVDRGGSWQRWVVATDGELVFFPYLVARGSGELAATWFSGGGEKLRGHVARIDVGDGDEPFVRASEPFAIDSFVPGTDPPVRDPAGEYLPVIFLADGGLGLVAPIQNPAAGRRGFAWYRVRQ